MGKKVFARSCGQIYIDMPFSGVTGMRPDLNINPHAFPSRMTIAMLLESVAAKGGSLHGKFVDATPFSGSVGKANGEAGSESSSLVDELGSMLTSYGFNYHGVEVLYSGVYGTELTCEIFIGPVYYQRLRHMVSDKFQVRSTGTETGLLDNLLKEESVVGVSVLEKWNETPCLLMGLHIYYMTGFIHALITTSQMCVPYVEASSQHQSSRHKSEQ